MSKKTKVYIGIGHGGSDPGAVANGLKEKNVNLVIGKAAAVELERHGVDVMLSRTTDITEGTSAKAKECNAFNPDLAADIHNNAGGGDGAEVYHTLSGGTGKELALNILKEVEAIGQNSRGAKTKRGNNGDYYGFIRDTKCPAVIVECAFLDNKKDVQIIDTTAEQQAMGVAIAKGFLRQLKIPWEAPAVEAPEDTVPDKEYLYRVQVGAYRDPENAGNMQDKLKAAGFPAIIVKAEK